MKFKNIDQENEFQLEEVQSYIEDSCQQKIARAKIKRLRRSNEMLKKRYVAKQSSNAKQIAIFRRNIEKSNSNSLNHIFRLEKENQATFKDTMFYQEKKQRKLNKKVQDSKKEKIFDKF